MSWISRNNDYINVKNFTARTTKMIDTYMDVYSILLSHFYVN